jgi:ribosomal protein S18 acetylase RimI-like enzyme
MPGGDLMFDFRLRPAAQHDFSTIIRLVQALLSEMHTLSSCDLTNHTEAWLDFETRILRTLSGGADSASRYPCAADHLLEIAETIGGEVLSIGLIEASILPPTPLFRPAQILQIHALYVRPRYRRRGVGTALLRSAITWGQRHHCVCAQLSVLPHNPARQLYQKLGFCAFGLEMRKELLSTN